MFDIVGNIKIADKTRLGYALATIRSFLFVKNDIGFYLNVNCDGETRERIVNEMSSYPTHSVSFDSGRFNSLYCKLLNKCNHDYVLHFEEDHFCICDSRKLMKMIIATAKAYNVDLIKATFFELEKDCYRLMSDVIKENEYCKIIENTPKNFRASKHHTMRYYIGNNCFFKKKFALKYWSQDKDTEKPHSFERKDYEARFHHVLMIPKIEILTPIDDDHKTGGSCLLNKPNDKWIKLK